MTLEEKVWNDLVQRKMFCSARQISKKLMVSISYVRMLLIAYHNRGILERKLKDKTYLYRIKP
jgi:predicted DNA-binding transcriptional regulator